MIGIKNLLSRHKIWNRSGRSRMVLLTVVIIHIGMVSLSVYFALQNYMNGSLDILSVTYTETPNVNCSNIENNDNDGSCDFEVDVHLLNNSTKYDQVENKTTTTTKHRKYIRLRRGSAVLDKLRVDGPGVGFGSRVMSVLNYGPDSVDVNHIDTILNHLNQTEISNKKNYQIINDINLTETKKLFRKTSKRKDQHNFKPKYVVQKTRLPKSEPKIWNIYGNVEMQRGRNENKTHSKLKSAMFKRTKPLSIKQTKNQISNEKLVKITHEFGLPKHLNLDEFKVMLDNFKIFHSQSSLKIDVKKIKPPKFLSNYKNPCWLAPLTERDVSPNLQLPGKYRMKEMIKHMTPVWIDRLRRHVNYKIKCLPYVYVVGFPKCGTTDMTRRLHRHPDVAISKKEFHWWAKIRAPKAKGNVSLCHYTDLFNEAAEILKQSVSKASNDESFHKKIIIDGSPSTVFNCSLEEHNNDGPVRIIADDILHIQGNKSKFIVMLRDPVERLYSEFIFFRRSKPNVAVTPEIFDKMARKGIKLFNECLKSHPLRRCVYKSDIHLEHSFRVGLGIYDIYLRDWFNVVGDDLLPIVLEEFADNKTNIMTAIFNHLNIERLNPLHMDGLGMLAEHGENEVKQKYGKMLTRTRTLLQRFYSGYNRQLENTLGKKLIKWKY